MSMLQAQADELRAMAESVGLAVPQAATLMMGAADTIEGLETENARLRERGAKTFEVGKRWMAKAARFESENAKLRELVRAAWRCIHTGASCSDCRLIAGGCTLQTAMRELRVEL